MSGSDLFLRGAVSDAPNPALFPRTRKAKKPWRPGPSEIVAGVSTLAALGMAGFIVMGSAARERPQQSAPVPAKVTSGTDLRRSPAAVAKDVPQAAPTVEATAPFEGGLVQARPSDSLAQQFLRLGFRCTRDWGVTLRDYLQLSSTQYTSWKTSYVVQSTGERHIILTQHLSKLDGSRLGRFPMSQDYHYDFDGWDPRFEGADPSEMLERDPVTQMKAHWDATCNAELYARRRAEQQSPARTDTDTPSSALNTSN